MEQTQEAKAPRQAEAWGGAEAAVGVVVLQQSLVATASARFAATLRPGTAPCQKDDFLKLVPEIALRTAEGS